MSRRPHPRHPRDRPPASRPRPADAGADWAAARGLRLGAALAAAIATLLWPLRFQLVLLGAFAKGLTCGMVEETRLVRKEWKERDKTQVDLAEVVRQDEI